MASFGRLISGRAHAYSSIRLPATRLGRYSPPGRVPDGSAPGIQLRIHGGPPKLPSLLSLNTAAPVRGRDKAVVLLWRPGRRPRLGGTASAASHPRDGKAIDHPELLAPAHAAIE